ncbi:hypothetical protein [Bordetella sp. N]|uniref:hypothetical protein n=1 Tax=Bordetella sp. N TaxID=1746199 RepID=UPI00070AF24F|nr:hypothetical protein [Bordetella sp. N]ALM83225.1 hypothetical protein ASB57_09840 [Bordetella sp. N]
MKRIPAAAVLSALLVAGCLPGGAAAESSATLSCPAALDTAYTPPAGARMTGSAVSEKMLLTHASMATGIPADQNANALSEFEQDEESTKDGVVTYTYYYETTAQSPLSVICGYGDPHGAKPPLLLLPVPSGTKGDCKFRMPATADAHGATASMTCSAH